MSLSPSLKYFDFFFVLRPMLFFPGWSTLLAGYLITSKNQWFWDFTQIKATNYLEISILLFVFMAAMGGSFLLNQLKDIETDLKNKKLFILSENHISKKSAIIETAILFGLALILALLQNSAVFIATLIFIIITGYAYNFKPFELKDKPVGSLLANAAMGWLAFSIGWFAVNDFGWLVFLDAIPYLFFNTALYFFTTIPDIEGDRKSKKRTLAVLFGEKYVINIAVACYVISLIASVILLDYPAIIFTTLSLPFFISVFRNKTIAAAIKTTKFSILFFALAVCLKIPFYFILMITIFGLTKWYFRMRFNYNYPNFKGD